jgi:galacturonosyltransferase
MACGTPVIAGNVPGARVVVDHGIDGYCTDPLDIEDIAAKLRAMISMSDADRQAMGLAGRRKVEERYSWERIGDTLERLYVDVVGETKLPSSVKQSASAEVQQ